MTTKKVKHNLQIGGILGKSTGTLSGIIVQKNNVVRIKPVTTKKIQTK